MTTDKKTKTTYRVCEDGSLASAYEYVKWQPSDEQVWLDGDFTAEELRAIADHMDEYKR